MSKDLEAFITRLDKENLLSHKGLVIWMTGYSGSGKTTLAYELERKFHEDGILTKVLDEDILTLGLNSNLTLDVKDRSEYIRRTAELAKQLASCGVVVICSIVTPTNALRDLAEEIIGEDHFILYHIATSLAVCEHRDRTGYYIKDRNEDIRNSADVADDFEYPTKALFSIDTENISIEESVNIIFGDLFDLLTI